MRRSLLAGGLVLIAACAGAAGPAKAADVLVFAAASLKTALDDAARGFEEAEGGTVRLSYAASSALARQLENGAPADIFISADLDWMDYVEKKGLIEPGTRRNLLGNRLVLVAPANSAIEAAIAPGFPLLRLLGGGRLAMADPASVPAGKYGKHALESLGVWDSVASRVAPAEDVRAALRFVSRGEAPLGIVYETDAAADPGVKIEGRFPDGSYPAIIYPIAEIAGRSSPAADKFMAYLSSAAAQPIFAKQGFAVLQP
jgi:molybdate transport system substrate-binding protein